MKRIVASIGVAALGAACVQHSNAQAMDGSKPWTLSLALRGFYDDNVTTTKTGKVDTYGGEISPTIAFVLPDGQTTGSLLYTYNYKYYDKSPNSDGDYDDQTHTVSGNLRHSFNERTTISLSDSFVIGQEPDVLRSGPDYPTFQRISGDNVRNYGNFTLSHQFTPKFGIEVGYANSIYDYEDDEFALQYFLGNPANPVVAVNPISYSGTLDRMEQATHLDARWTILPTTIGLLGYAFSYDHYTADQPIGVAIVNPAMPFGVLVDSDDRDSYSHYVYVGAEHSFNPSLRGSLKVGARFSDYFNSPAGESTTSPYASAMLNYDFAKKSSFQMGVTHDMSATDAFSTATLGGSITTDSESTTVYASLTHRILAKLTGTLMGQFQNSVLNGGRFDDDAEQFYLFSASLEYHINRHISATLSYHYDQLESEVPNRGFDRNRVFLGAIFTY